MADALLNELAARNLHFTRPANAIGQLIQLKDSYLVRVSGIVKDFRNERMTHAIKPVLIYDHPADYKFLQVKVARGMDQSQMKQALATRWKELSALTPLEADWYADQLYEANLLHLTGDFFWQIWGQAAWPLDLSRCTILKLAGPAVFGKTEIIRTEAADGRQGGQKLYTHACINHGNPCSDVYSGTGSSGPSRRTGGDAAAVERFGIARTTPVLMGLFSIVTPLANTLWQAGFLLKPGSSWYEKEHLTFSDTINNVRCWLWGTLNFQTSASETG